MCATRLAKLDKNAYYQTKLRTRRELIKALKIANRKDMLDIITLGIKRMIQ